MRIRHLRLSNFRSFDELDLRLEDFGVLVGANAAGKSNLVEAMRFIRDIGRHGLPNAVSMQGGVEYLRNMSIGPSRPTTISCTFVGEMWYGPLFRLKGSSETYLQVDGHEVTVSFSLQYPKRAPTFKVIAEVIEAPVDARTITRDSGSPAWKGMDVPHRPATIRVTREKNRPTVAVTFQDTGEPVAIESTAYYLPSRVPVTELMWQHWQRYMTLGPTAGEVSIYDFDPKLPKRAVQITGRRELEEDGSNLALALQRILLKRESKRQFTNLVRDLLPFVEKFSIESIADRSIYFSLHDRYNSGRGSFPASFMSDGTINVLALVCAAFFESAESVVIEEPERNLHPALISKIVALLRDAARDKQLLLTTHHPEVLKHAGLESLLLARRSEAGFTEIVRPSESAVVQSFLSNDIGLDDLFIQNLLAMD